MTRLRRCALSVIAVLEMVAVALCLGIFAVTSALTRAITGATE